MHVLVVADEAWVHDEVAAALGEARFEITAVRDPHTVVAACTESGADVVVCDLQVGAMGGMAVVRSIRGAIDAGRLPRTPTVLLLDRGADAFLARRAGADAAIRKPFGAFDLRDMLDELVGRPAPAGTE